MNGTLSRRTTAALIAVGIAEGEHGGTFTLDGSETPTTGYFVGGVVPSLVIRKAREGFHYEIIREFVLDAPDGSMVGFWFDGDTGACYVDVVDHVILEEFAKSVGRARGELAIWDVANAEEIRTEAVTV